MNTVRTIVVFPINERTGRVWVAVCRRHSVRVGDPKGYPEQLAAIIAGERHCRENAR